MGEKTVLIDVKQTMSRQNAAAKLREIAEDLSQGRVMGEGGEYQVGDTTRVKIKGKVKHKDEGDKGKLKVSICWGALGGETVEEEEVEMGKGDLP